MNNYNIDPHTPADYKIQLEIIKSTLLNLDPHTGIRMFHLASNSTEEQINQVIQEGKTMGLQIDEESAPEIDEWTGELLLGVVLM